MLHTRPGPLDNGVDRDLLLRVRALLSKKEEGEKRKEKPRNTSLLLFTTIFLPLISVSFFPFLFFLSFFLFVGASTRYSG